MNAFHLALRQAALSTVLDIADQCDGKRCDMAMLMMNSVFERTWGSRAGRKPGREYWVELIKAVIERHPDILFMAEAYWDLEWELQQQGFNYCYDKRLYDRLEHNDAEDVRRHLCADSAYREKLVRFIENHDEPRAAAAFAARKAMAPAVTCAMLIGARLFHGGASRRPPGEAAGLLAQASGRSLGPCDAGILQESPANTARRRFQGRGQDIVRTDGMAGHRKLQERGCLVLGEGVGPVSHRHNLSEAPAQARVAWPWGDAGGRLWRLTDTVRAMVFERAGDELQGSGLYVDLEPWGFHLLKIDGRSSAELNARLTHIIHDGS